MAKAEKHTLKLEIEKPQYITVNDVTYAQVDSWFGHCRRDLKLDIIYPEAQDGRTYPCILWICGGAWLMMDKSAHNLYLSRLASGGFVVASVENRTSNPLSESACRPVPYQQRADGSYGRIRRRISYMYGCAGS